jgi:SnoaL-like domain
MSPDDVRTTVLAVVHCIDARKWKELPELFAATVAVDYTSLFGGAASQTKASELVGGWRTALEGVVTQHLLGPIDVRITREGAHAGCHVRALHYRVLQAETRGKCSATTSSRSRSTAVRGASPS